LKVRACGLEFESVRGWECLPAGWSHPDVASVATDEAANVYLFCRGDWPVIVYDSAGRLLHSWGTGQFSYRTHGMFIVGGHLYLVDDGGNRVGEYTLNGTFVRSVHPRKPATPRRAAATTPPPSGRVPVRCNGRPDHTTGLRTSRSALRAISTSATATGTRASTGSAAMRLSSDRGASPAQNPDSS